MTTPARYETVTGAGPAAPWLTLVHALSQHRGVFAAQVPALRAEYRLLLVDLPGHGASADLPGPYGLAEHAAAVAAALAEAGVTRTHWWGSHTGAGVGLLLACREPALFASLVLEGVVIPGRLPPSVLRMNGELAALIRERGLAAAREHWWQASPWFAAMRNRPAEFRAAGQRALVDAFPGAPWLAAADETAPQPAPIEPLEDALAGLDLPVLLVNGELDVPDFIAQADELATTLPNARRVTIPEAGGFPLWERPEQVNAAVQAWLGEVG